ncbi:hypothetical protein CDCA_CDCA02G0765 [Cyanidium caldarium]|uniref:Mitochondrial import inner membrane translocase subunit TIM22 n=1 Tax=Cyanidium caldarium TaxID=2771 RepID=A0AAV9IR00_CYACA|nr:hypothetical protein CDCA_CDCA02G0765 [Cyanidium caldarium]
MPSGPTAAAADDDDDDDDNTAPNHAPTEDGAARAIHLPRPGMPAYPPHLQTPPVHPAEVWAQTMTESCAFKAAMAAVAGGGLGVAMGLFIGGFSLELDRAVEAQAPWRQQLRMYGRALGAQIRSYSKSFALWGSTYTIVECGVEKYRARHDLWNSPVAGCATGAVLASQPRVRMDARNRLKQMAVGCVGMALFSTAIDYWLEHRHE